MKRCFLLLSFILLLAGCSTPDEYQLRNDPDSKAPVKVAALLPLSGVNRVWAEQMKEGLQMAETDVNSKHGVNGRLLQLEILDTGGTAEGSAAAARKAADLGAVAMVAGVDTEEVSRIIRYAAPLRMPTVIPVATSDAHISVSPFVYRNSYTDSQQAEVLMAYLYYWRKVRNLAVVIDPADSEEYSRSLCRNASQGFQDIGGAVGYTLMLPAKGLPDEDFVRLLMSNPEAIFIPSRPKRAAAIIRKLRRMGFHGILCGPDIWDDEELFKHLRGCETGDCAYIAFFSPENETPEFKTFQKRFREKFFHFPGAVETQSYDALRFLAVGIGTAATLPEFEKNWLTLRNHTGAAARYTMLPKGEIDRTIHLNTIGIRREGSNVEPFGRPSVQIQYSKLKEYQSSFDE